MIENYPMQPGAGKGRRQVRILFTCAGRRVELIQAFLRAGRALGLKVIAHAADTEAHFATGCLASKSHRVPATTNPSYIPKLLAIVRRYKIDLLVPLLDMELAKLADARAAFGKVGCGVLVSSPEVVRICRDKLATFDFLTRNNIDTPMTWPAAMLQKKSRHNFPYFLKPRKGSASKGNFVLRNKSDLLALVPQVPEAIIQEYVEGVEYTLDVYSGLDGKPRCAVPRRRLEVRGGEVTRASTYWHKDIIQAGLRVVEALGECVGVITIQLIMAPEGRIRIIEINPRFGGGVPLAIQAGADFPKWLLMEWLGRRPRIRLSQFRSGVIMLRYYQAYFVHDSERMGSKGS
ncbi:MAG: ATP-grasp domain-containing protein [Phycisphaerales bacterium]|nr:ATP-grasp domain-containing protein [Phycisphaerales bacterium]